MGQVYRRLITPWLRPTNAGATAGVAPPFVVVPDISFLPEHPVWYFDGSGSLVLFGDPPIIDYVKRYSSASGRYRIFNDAEYRLYRSNTGPPTTSDAWTTSATLPVTPVETFADGTWWIAVSYFNGVIDSGFLPLNDRGENYVRIDISGGEAVDRPPYGPLFWSLTQAAGGVPHISAVYIDESSNRADNWAITYTTNGSTPAEGVPDIAVAIASVGTAVLEYDLPAQADTTVVKVRLQTALSTSYSEDSDVKQITIDTTAASAPITSETLRGTLPE